MFSCLRRDKCAWPIFLQSPSSPNRRLQRGAKKSRWRHCCQVGELPAPDPRRHGQRTASTKLEKTRRAHCAWRSCPISGLLLTSYNSSDVIVAQRARRCAAALSCAPAHLSIHPPIHSSIHPSIHPRSQPSIHLSVYPFTRPSIHSSTHGAQLVPWRTNRTPALAPNAGKSLRCAAMGLCQFTAKRPARSSQDNATIRCTMRRRR